MLVALLAVTPAAQASPFVTVRVTIRDPKTIGYWKTHREQWSAELLARIQATDQRFDGADGSAAEGRLSTAEVTTVFAREGDAGASAQRQGQPLQRATTVLDEINVNRSPVY